MAIPFQEQSQTSANEAVNIDIPEKLLQIVYGTPRENNYHGRQMQRVQPMLRLDKNNQQDYDPLVVSLGPYHHGKKELQLAEDFKLTALEMVVVDSGQNVEFLYTRVLQLVNEAKNCYIGDSTKDYDDPTFAQMMLLDACFIINFIAISEDFNNFNLYVTRYHLGDLVFPTVLRDLFLLENQIPFKILKLLICLIYGLQEGEEMLNKFLARTLFAEYKGGGIASTGGELPLHLLDAFRLVLLSESPKEKPTTPIFSHLRQYISNLPCFPQKRANDSNNSTKKYIGNLGKFSNLLQYISNLPCFPHRRANDTNNSMKKYVHSFHSATDLKAKGIHFRPSSAYSLKGIKFKSSYFYAILEVPVWFVSVYTKVLFLNMIAFELCPSTSTDRTVTAYIEFMQSLIDIPKDVKELREKRILLTTLGSNEDIVKVYKEINTYGWKNVKIFHDVKKEIQAYYNNNNQVKTWLTELYYTYLRSPWTAIALFAATFLLVLTFLQTYYTVRPS